MADNGQKGSRATSGRSRGQATSQKYGPEFYERIGQKGGLKPKKKSVSSKGAQNANG